MRATLTCEAKDQRINCMFEQAAPVLRFKRSDYRSNLAGNRIKWLILQGFKELVWGRRYGK
jgi:hypothetical protein